MGQFDFFVTLALTMALKLSKTNTIDVISPLCIRIKNAFTQKEIRSIHECYAEGIKPTIDIAPGSKLKALMNEKFIDCVAMGACTNYRDNQKNEDEQEELVQIKISQTVYTQKHGIAETICFLPISRLDEQHLIANHSKILCETEHRNF